MYRSLPCSFVLFILERLNGSITRRGRIIILEFLLDSYGFIIPDANPDINTDGRYFF